MTKAQFKQKGRVNWRLYAVVGVVLFINAFLVYASTISSFYGQDNPFNISLKANNNQTFYIPIPLYAYITNLTTNMLSYPNFESFIDDFEYADDPTNHNFFDIGTGINPVNVYINTTTHQKYSGSRAINISGTADTFLAKYNLTIDNVHPSTNISFSIWVNITSTEDDNRTYIRLARPDDTHLFSFFSENDQMYIKNATQTDVSVLARSQYVNKWINYQILKETNTLNYTVLISNQTNNLYNISMGLAADMGNVSHLRFDQTGTDMNTLYDFLEFEYGDKKVIRVNSPSSSYLLNNSGSISFNNSNFNNILENDCNCTNCSIVGTNCLIPIVFSSTEDVTLEVNLSNATIYTNLSIHIFDRIEETYITNNVNVTISGYGLNQTKTGYLNYHYFPTSPASWSIYAESEGYQTGLKEFILTDRNSTNVSIYLFNTSGTNAGNLIVQTFDEFYNYIVGANVKLLEYFPSLDSFIEVDQCYSDTNGECIFGVELNTKYYIVQATFDDLFAQSTSTGQQIIIDNTIIELHLKTTQGYTLPSNYDLNIIPSNTELVGNTSFLTATFNDPSNNEHEVCIGYYTIAGLEEREYLSTCVIGSSGIVNYAGGYVLDRDFTWLAKIYTLEGNKTTVYNSYRYEALSGTFLTDFGIWAKPFIFALLLIGLALALYLKSIQFFAYWVIALSPTALTLHPNLYGGVTMTFIILMGLIILYLSGKKQSYE